jgi:undecaprenyl-phosphate 4-deoxy-4-formamido-L-arabinose transferase
MDENLKPSAEGPPRRALSVVVPVFNSATSLATLAERLAEVLPGLAERYELILVDDGSPDGSWEQILRLTGSRPWITGIRLMRNYGQHNALLCGIRAAGHPVVITMDDDLQHPPEEIGKLLARLEEGFDVVYGSPEREQHGLLRNLASIVTKLALKNAMGVENARNVSAFRAFRTQVRDGFAAYHGPYVSIDVLLTWGTSRFSSVTVRHDPRLAGSSNYGVARLMRHAMNMVTGFSVRPLQIASLLGFLFALFGVAVFLLVVVRYLIYGGTVPGFSFLASIIAVFAGAQLLAIGITGEYLARMHFRLMDRPPYVMGQRVRGADEEEA